MMFPKSTFSTIRVNLRYGTLTKIVPRHLHRHWLKIDYANPNTLVSVNWDNACSKVLSYDCRIPKWQKWPGSHADDCNLLCKCKSHTIHLWSCLIHMNISPGLSRVPCNKSADRLEIEMTSKKRDQAYKYIILIIILTALTIVCRQSEMITTHDLKSYRNLVSPAAVLNEVAHI